MSAVTPLVAIIKRLYGNEDMACVMAVVSAIANVSAWNKTIHRARAVEMKMFHNTVEVLNIDKVL